MTDQSGDGECPEDDYEVGYGRPPKHTQFPPGKSGNPKGRKKKPQSVQAQAQKTLAKRVKINEGGKTKSLPMQEVILRTIANKAAKGDLRAAMLLFRLRNAPEFADADVIDQGKLSAEDQAMFEQFLGELDHVRGAEMCTQPDLKSEDSLPAVPPPPPPLRAPENTNPEREEPHDDE